jgi:hypothetical protein
MENLNLQVPELADCVELQKMLTYVSIWDRNWVDMRCYGMILQVRRCIF